MLLRQPRSVALRSFSAAAAAAVPLLLLLPLLFLLCVPPVLAQGADALSCGTFTGSSDAVEWELCSDFSPSRISSASSLSFRASVAPEVPGGWVSLGFAPVGQTPRMSNGKVMIGWVNGATNFIDNYNLVSHNSGSGGQTSLGASTKSASVDAQGRTVLSWTVPLGAAGSSNAFVAEDGSVVIGSLTLIAADGSVGVISARGRAVSSPGGSIPQHTRPTGNSNAFNLDTGDSSVLVDDQLEERKRWRAAHGFLMAIAWALFIPLSIITARYFKSAGPRCWFVGHQVLVLSGVAMALAAFVIGLTKINDGQHPTHRGLGIAAMSLAFANPLIAAIRPPPAKVGEPKPLVRTVWEIVHKSVGRCAYVLAIVNCFIGLSYFNSPPGSGSLSGNDYTIAFLVVWLAVMALALILEIRAWSKGWDAPAPGGLVFGGGANANAAGEVKHTAADRAHAQKREMTNLASHPSATATATAAANNANGDGVGHGNGHGNGGGSKPSSRQRPSLDGDKSTPSPPLIEVRPAGAHIV